MNSRYGSCLRFVVLLLLCVGNAHAEPLYPQLVKQATVSDKVLKEAGKQVREHKKVKVLDALSVAPFHKRDTQQETAKQPLCLVCHLTLPHRKNERSRTFMNMHSRFIACETCHLRPKDIPLEYRWLAYDGPDAGHELAPRSTVVAIEKTKVASEENKQGSDNKEKRKKKEKVKKVPLAPQSGARIAPFFNGEPVLLFKDSSFAQQAKRKWKEAEDERAELKARLHAPLEKEGPACQRCHGKKKPLFDLEALGATAKQVKAIQQNTITRFFERFKKKDERIRIGKDLLK
jgi:hypothetical protein